MFNARFVMPLKQALEAVKKAMRPPANDTVASSLFSSINVPLPALFDGLGLDEGNTAR